MRASILLLCGFLVGPGFAGSLERMRQIPLADFIKVDRTWERSGLFVSAISFSPDEQWIAVVAGTGGISGGRLLVVSRERRAGDLRYSGEIQSNSAGAGKIAWSSDGNTVVVGANPPLVVNLEDGRTCTLFSSGSDRSYLLGGFVSAGNIVTAESDGKTSRLVLYEPGCTPEMYRDLPAKVHSLETQASKGWVALSTGDNHLRIYDGKAGTVLKDWRRASSKQIGFLSRGDVICEASLPTEARVGPNCWNVDNEKDMRSPEIWGGVPFNGAQDGSVAVFTEGKYGFDPFFETAKYGVKRGLAWDFNTGHEVFTWRPETQPCDADDLWGGCRIPAAFALSPSGSYFVEARSGQLRLYRVRS